eukprot:4065948-Amphidinium_carterae.1
MACPDGRSMLPRTLSSSAALCSWPHCNKSITDNCVGLAVSVVVVRAQRLQLPTRLAFAPRAMQPANFASLSGRCPV